MVYLNLGALMVSRSSCQVQSSSRFKVLDLIEAGKPVAEIAVELVCRLGCRRPG